MKRGNHGPFGKVRAKQMDRYVRGAEDRHNQCQTGSTNQGGSMVWSMDGKQQTYNDLAAA